MLTDWKDGIRLMDYVEAWFDFHPEPWNIDTHWFTFEKYNADVHVYFADQVFDTWLVKITCKSAEAALQLKKLLYKTTCQMDISLVLINNKLFLLKDQRF